MKRIWAKVLTALRIRQREAEIPSHEDTLQLIKKQIRSSEHFVETSQAALADLMAKHILIKKSAAQFLAQSEELTAVARAALASGDERAALQIAVTIGRLYTSVEDETQRASVYMEHIEDIRCRLDEHEGIVRVMEHWFVQIAAAAGGVEAVQSALPTSGSEAAPILRLAEANLHALRQRQQEAAAYFQAQQETYDEFDDGALEQRLRDAQVVQGAADPRVILARIKTQSVNPIDEPGQLHLARGEGH